jgi:hypothetical protein
MVSGATVRRVYILERLDSDCVLAHNQAKLDIEAGNASRFYVVRMLACDIDKRVQHEDRLAN